MLFNSWTLEAIKNGFILLITYTISKGIYNVYFHPLSKFPGPKSFAISHLRFAIASLRGTSPVIVKSLHERYGSVVRVAPNELAYCSASALQDIATHPGLQKSTKFYTRPPTGPASIISVSNNADHSRYRRLLSHAFSEKALREQEPLIVKYIDSFIAQLHDNSDTPQDMTSWFNFVAFDIIGDLTLGESFNCLRDTALHPWVSLFFQYFKGTAIIGAIRRFPWLCGLMLPLLVPKSLAKSRVQHMKVTREKVLSRIEGGTGRPDFMTNILKHNDKETGMTTDEIVSAFGILLIAGSETTATLLSAVLFYLLTNPDVMKRLEEEIRTSFATEDAITMISVNKLKYELAVLDEGLRILPPAPLGTIRETPPEGALIDGEFVPGRTTVYVATYSTHRQESNWKDADSFKPERWLNDPKYRSDNRASFSPFSVGPRNCVGRNLAYFEMRLILARLIWNFDLKLESESRDWTNRMKNFILWEKPSLMVNLTRVARG